MEARGNNDRKLVGVVSMGNNVQLGRTGRVIVALDRESSVPLPGIENESKRVFTYFRKFQIKSANSPLFLSIPNAIIIIIIIRKKNLSREFDTDIQFVGF